MVDKDVIAAEAAALAARFADGVRQAKFARDHHVPGGPSLLSQHIKGRRPMSLDSAMAYARGFEVSLRDISERLANQASQAAVFVTNYDEVVEKAVNSANVAKLATPTDRLTEAIVTIGGALAGMDPVRRSLAAGALHFLIDNPRQSTAIADQMARLANDKP